MNTGAELLKGLYITVLKLYPIVYQREYSEELELVFELVVDGTAPQGRLALLKLGLVELYTLPGAILSAHWRERRKGKLRMEINSVFNFKPGSWGEFLAAAGPFLLGIISTISSYLAFGGLLPNWIQILFALLFLGLTTSLIVLGIFKGLPRWFYPYLGFACALGGLLIFNLLVSGIRRPIFPEDSWVISMFFFSGLLWGSTLGVGICLFAFINTLQSLRQRIHSLREDWSQVSLIFIGSGLFSLVITFDEYRDHELYMVLGLIILAGAIWVYLRSENRTAGLLALSLGFVLAMGLAAMGKAILYSSPGWPHPQSTSTWQREAVSTLVNAAWLLVLMWAPILYQRFSHRNEPLKAK